jgi:hypothetical protein
LPFTLAHPAAVLPLHGHWRRGLLPLAIGSVAPDIPYFLPHRVALALPSGHTLWGALTISAPLAALMLLIVVLLREPLTAPLWGRHRVLAARAIDAFHREPWNWVAAVPALLLGIGLHILWDSFTHRTGWIVAHVAEFEANVSPLPGYPLELFRALQYLSSVGGLAAIAVWYRRRVRSVGEAAPASPNVSQSARVLALALVAAAAIAAGALAALRAGPRYGSFHGTMYLTTTAAISAAVVTYAIVGCVLALRDSRRQP